MIRISMLGDRGWGHRTSRGSVWWVWTGGRWREVSGHTVHWRRSIHRWRAVGLVRWGRVRHRLHEWRRHIPSWWRTSRNGHHLLLRMLARVWIGPICIHHSVASCGYLRWVFLEWRGTSNRRCRCSRRNRWEHLLRVTLPSIRPVWRDSRSLRNLRILERIEVIFDMNSLLLDWARAKEWVRLSLLLRTELWGRRPCSRGGRSSAGFECRGIGVRSERGCLHVKLERRRSRRIL